MVPTPIETLASFIRTRRARLGLGHNALARAAGIDPGSLSNLLNGRVRTTPELPTLHKLAVGLAVEPELLIRIASGYEVDLETALESGTSATPPAPGATPAPGGAPSADAGSHSGRFPLSVEEIKLLMEAVKYGIFWDLTQDPELLDIPPADRKWIFKDLENVLRARAKFGPPGARKEK